MSLFISTDPPRKDAFRALPVSAAAHFRLWYLAAVVHVVERLARNLGSLDSVRETLDMVGTY